MIPIDLARAEAITGWMSPAELTWLATRALSARTIIEIGSFCGRSTRALADHCPGVVYAIDPWEGYSNDDDSQAKWILEQGPGSWIAIVEAFNRNLADHIASGRVVPVRLRAFDAYPTFSAKQAFKADLVFIDGDHRYDSCRQDILRYRDLVTPGGILAGHDYRKKDWPGVTRAVDELVGQVHRCESIWWVTR
jgi:predicted O-methyltransferase YrrM